MTIIVNTDYESVLFHNRPSLKMKRELEFLGLWLNDRVLNIEEYEDSYLLRITRYTGKPPELIKKDPKAMNWWGELKDITNEQYLNSKETSFKISQLIGEEVGMILEDHSQLKLLDQDRTYLFKNYSGVSGKGHKFLSQLKTSDFPLIAEEFHLREIDFSTYCTSLNEYYFYQNFISPQFGYKGSFFDLEKSQELMELDFVKKRSHLPWRNYLTQVRQITSLVRERGDHGFSIDSYIYEDKIRALCEINYRRTMGITGLEIARRVSQKRFHLFLIFKNNGSYQELLSFSDSIESVLLSHEKNMFSYLLISDDSKDSVREKLQSLESFLLKSLAIDIE